MSRLLDLRKAIKAEVLKGELWEDKAVIIHRRLKIWNEVATAINASKHGAVLVIGTAKGDPDRERQRYSTQLIMEVTIPVTLIELPKVDPDGAEEDLLWEQTVVRLQGNGLERAGKQDLVFDGFDDIEDDRYVIRQTIFKTRLILNKENTPN